jgi:signal-transduction protein with cAMP-binding, CBS, and nucleotidyltransferase domain
MQSHFLKNNFIFDFSLLRVTFCGYPFKILFMDSVKKYIIRKMLSIDSEAIVAEAAIKMEKEKVGSLLVTKKNKIVGIITEGDLSRRVMAKELAPLSTEVRQIMSSPLVSVPSEATMPSAFLVMIDNDLRHLAVKEDGKVIGMLSMKDFGHYYTDKFYKK